MKYAFIQRHRRVWPITVQCRVLQVSVSGYHAHLARKASTAPRRHLSDDALLVHIKAVHAQTRGSYGRPRILRELRNDGVPVGKQRLQRLMQEHGIRAKGKKRFRVTTDSHHDLPIAPNLLDRQFAVEAPDKVWVGDITYSAPSLRKRHGGGCRGLSMFGKLRTETGGTKNPRPGPKDFGHPVPLYGIAPEGVWVIRPGATSATSLYGVSVR